MGSKDILSDIKKLSNTIDKIRELEDLELSDLDDRIRQMHSNRDAIAFEYDQKVSILNSELELLRKNVIVDNVIFEVNSDNELVGMVFNYLKEPIALFNCGKITEGYFFSHYNVYQEYLKHSISIKEYVLTRIDYSSGISVDSFKIYFNGLAYPVKLTLL